MNELKTAGRLVQRTINGEPVDVVEKEFQLLAYDPLTRTGEIVASDETVDRYGDVVVAAGWKLDNYLKNPVMLLDHSYQVADIVGQASPRIEGNRLVARFVLDDPAANRQAAIVANLIKNRSLRAVSVGFQANAFDRIEDEKGNWTGGFRFTDQELLEISWVAVPANPNAVLAATEPERPSDERMAPVQLALAAAAIRAGR